MSALLTGSPRCPSKARVRPVADEMPHSQHDHRTDDRTDQPGALPFAIPVQRLPQPGGDEAADDAKQDGEDESARVVRGWREELGDDPSDTADDDHPQQIHARSPPSPKPGSRPTGRFTPVFRP